MSAHLATERLSAYLDDELDTRDLRRVEEHVHECAHCQHRLRGLRQVVDDLQRMPALTAPLVPWRAVDREASARWRARREAAFRGGGLPRGSEGFQSLIQLGFALVVAGSILLLLLVHAASRREAGSIPADQAGAPISTTR